MTAAGVKRSAPALVGLSLTLSCALVQVACESPRQGAEGDAGATMAPAGSADGPGGPGPGPNLPADAAAPSATFDGGSPPNPDSAGPAPVDAVSLPDLPPAPVGRQRVIISVVGPGQVTQVGTSFQCAGSCTLEAPIGSRVTLHAEPQSSSIPDAVTFLGWTGDCLGRADCTLAVDRDRPVVAAFRKFLEWEQPASAAAMAADATGLYAWGAFAGTTQIGGRTITSRGSADGVLARFDHAGVLQWVRTVGGSDQDRARALAVSSQRTLFVFGEAANNPLFDTAPLWGSAGGSGNFVSTVTADGQLLRTRPSTFIGGAAADGAGNLLVVNDSETGHLLKLDAQGGTIWEKNGITANWGFHKMPAADQAGNVAALHPLVESITVGGTTFTGQGQSDNLLISYTAAGAFRWAVPLRMDLSDGVMAMQFDPEGHLYLLINFNGQLRIGDFSKRSIDGGRDIALARLDGATGQANWLVSWGSSLIDVAGALAIDAYSSTVTVNFQSATQVASTRLDPGPAVITFVNGTGQEAFVGNIGRDITALRDLGDYSLYLTKDGRVGRLVGL